MGATYGMLGKKHTEETKRKISEAHKGKKRPPFSKQWRENIGKAGKGKKRSPRSQKWRDNLSKSNKGQIAWNKGKHWTKEIRDKISRNTKGRIPWNKGITFMRGDKHPNWKGGVTPLLIDIRNCVMYQNWRKEIYARDRWLCQDCHNHCNGNINAHHLYPFAQIIEDFGIETLEEAESNEKLWDKNNAITLCRRCHRERHKKIMEVY